MRVQFNRDWDVNGTRYAQFDEADIDADIANHLIRQGVCRFLMDGDRHSHRWTDLAQGITSVNPAGSGAPPTVDATETGWPGSYLFRGTIADHLLVGQWQILHEWQEGTPLRPHIHWMLTADSAAAVEWAFHYRISGIGAAAGAWVGPVAGTLAVDHGGLADVQAVTTFGEIDLTGHTVSTLVWWRLYRTVSDANNDNARLLSIDAHYRKDGTGSTGEFTK